MSLNTTNTNIDTIVTSVEQLSKLYFVLIFSRHYVENWKWISSLTPQNKPMNLVLFLFIYY